jgi:hypothetical protein
MSKGPPLACPDGTVDDARWLFPQERAPPPRDEGCKQNGFGDPAPQASNGSPPIPSPPSKSSSFSALSTDSDVALYKAVIASSPEVGKSFIDMIKNWTRLLLRLITNWIRLIRNWTRFLIRCLTSWTNDSVR